MRELPELLHAIRALPDGGSVLVLDTGALIDPEARAMIFARFSRFTNGTAKLVEEMFDRDVGKFLRGNYQAGYGHKSIGELGDTAIGIHGVSMLAAKAIQDFPLYRGQESSTRYIDFSKQRFSDPVGSEESRTVLEGWRSFYLKALDPMIPILKERFPFDREMDKDEKVWEKAIKARAFDTVRCYLPAGATTDVAWVGDLRHINDHLATLRNHPLKEVREIALAVEDALIEKSPNSFSTKRYEATESYLRQMGAAYAYFHKDSWPSFEFEDCQIDFDLLDGYHAALASRPPKIELPFRIRECGSLCFAFTLDFGSFRDLQRHRAVIVPMPLLTDDLGFEDWYLKELPPALRKEAEELVSVQLGRIDMLELEPNETQYFMPMGMKVPIRLTGDLRALVYLVEQRATVHVHPTLRKRAIQMARKLKEELGHDGLVLHLDADPDRFDSKRGTHDIVRRT